MSDDFKGAGHFYEFVRSGEPEWALFAVEAPFDAVSDALVERHDKAHDRQTDVKRTGPEEQAEVAQLAAVIQIRDNPWTVVQRSVFFMHFAFLAGASDDSRALSERLGTRAVAHFAEDTSGSEGYELYENGEQVAREERDSRLVTGSHADARLTELGVYLPCCHPTWNEKTARLMVYPPSRDVVVRCDLIDLGAFGPLAAGQRLK